MERYSEVIGLPVICIRDGKKIGVIKDVIFCPKLQEVKGFLLERRGCQISKRVVLLKDVIDLGTDALVIDDHTCLKEFRKLKSTSELKDSGNVSGLRVYSRAGRDIGIVKDVLFDHKTGMIEGVEVSDGLIQDLVQGRNIVPLLGRVEFSEENILVDKEAVEEMMSTGGGLKKILMDRKRE